MRVSILCRHLPGDRTLALPFNTLNKWALGITDTLAPGLLCEYTELRMPIVAIPGIYLYVDYERLPLEEFSGDSESIPHNNKIRFETHQLAGQCRCCHFLRCRLKFGICEIDKATPNRLFSAGCSSCRQLEVH